MAKRMKKLWVVLMIFLFVGLGAKTLVMDQAGTVGGQVRILSERCSADYRVVFRGRTVTRYQGFAFSIDKKITFPDSTVLLISGQAGMGTAPDYRILEVYRNGTYRLSREFSNYDDFDSGATIRKRSDGTLRIDLGYSKGWKMIVWYRNGKIRTTYERARKRSLGKGDCHWLYNGVYRRFLGR